MIDITLEEQGLSEVSEMLKGLEKIDKNIVIELRPRSGIGSDDNAEILEYLDEIGKHYTHLSVSDLEKVAKEYVKEFEKKLDPKAVENTIELALEAAMKCAADIIGDNVENGGSVKTGQLLRNIRNGNTRITKGS